MSNESDYVSLGQVEFKHEETKAVLFDLWDHDEEEVWIPKSVIHEDCLPVNEDTIELEVKRWWAKEEGYAE